VGARFTDTAQLMPFLLRAWVYVSGVFYNLKAFAAGAPHWVSVLLDLNPAVVYIGLMRSALLTSVEQPVYGWQLGLAWAVVIGAGGYVFFWHAEEEYGRG
jgi:teichoic acid transport system permease protein